MNPKLIKFAVQLQNGEKVEEKEHNAKTLNKAICELAVFLKPAKADVRVDNNSN